MSNRNRKPCAKVKNACKYCLEQVTTKNGLQCQGACQKWAHYKCLNYTPGKISDIKAGIIKVMCPCPDCDTTQPKEFLTNPPYSCSKNKCPAKAPIKCDSEECPQNVGLSNERERECTKKPCNTNKPTDARPKCARTAPVRPPTPIRCRTEATPKRRQVKKIIPISSSDACIIPDCPNRGSNSSSDDENCPKTQESMVQALQEMCGTVGKLSVQIKDLMGKINKMA